MFNSKKWPVIIATPLISVLAGCSSLPGNRQTQGAVIGGAAGAAAGAAVGGKNNRGLGALIGGVLGAGGGYIIAAKTDKLKQNDRESATVATRKSQENPATAEDARRALTADVNLDGFVTLDEVVAMKQAGFSDEKMIDRLKATDQVFDLSLEQEKYLLDRGISRQVVREMSHMNSQQRDILLNDRRDVIGQPAR